MFIWNINTLCLIDFSTFRIATYSRKGVARSNGPKSQSPPPRKKKLNRANANPISTDIRTSPISQKNYKTSLDVILMNAKSVKTVNSKVNKLAHLSSKPDCLWYTVYN